MASYVMVEALKDALRKWAGGQEVVRVKDMERMIGSLAEKKVVGVLGDRRLHELEDAGMIQYDGPASIGPASLDLHLGTSFCMARPNGPVKLGDKVPSKVYAIMDDEMITINPGEFMLATTKEYIKLPDNICATVHGRSSIGRLGLTVQNAGFVDPGFEGEITLELKNETSYPIQLVPGYRVAQLVYQTCDGVENAYKGKYNRQRGATNTRMHEDAEASKE